MRAAVWNGPGAMSIGSAPDPTCPPDGVLLRVLACGICGTDVRSFYNGDRRIAPPWVLGHEISGEVVEIGPRAEREMAESGLELGHHVHCISTLWCGRCRMCRGGHENLCLNGELMGFDHPGAYAEHVAIPQIALKNLFRIPPGLSAAHATFADPLSDVICGHKDLAITLDDVVAVIGAGPVGAAHAALARLQGAGRVMLQTLGVLRRPPDAASRLAISCVKTTPKPGSAAFRACRTSAISLAFAPFPGAPRFGASSGVRLDPSLIRVVPVPRSGDSVALIPATAPASPGSSRRAEGLDISIASPAGAASPGPTPTSVTELRTHGLAVSGTNATPTMRSVFGAVVVPDGVATVTLQPIRLISAPAPVDPRRFGTSTTSVHDNIAAYRFRVPYVQDPRQKSLVYAVTVVARATWRDRHGNVIAQTTTHLQLWLKVRGDNGPITATN
jgi:Alcohol dehydrogenase GroES-like domain